MSDDESSGVQLPPGWKASLDKRTGRSFYVNLVTKERTWYRPLRDDEPRDFYRKFDRKTGKIYYVNFATKKTCWKLPPRAVVKDVRDLKLSAAERRKQKKTPSPAKEAGRAGRSGETQQVFEEADTNGDGVLDQREFAQLIQKARATAVGSRPASERKRQQQQQQQQQQQPARHTDTVAARDAAQHRLPHTEQRPSRGSPSVHISRNGSVHISPARQPQQQQQQQDFPQVDNESEASSEDGDAAGAGAGAGPRSTGDFKRRIQEMGAAAQREADAGAGAPNAGTPHSRTLYPVDSGERSGRPAADETQSAAYHGATHAKSGVSTLAAHGPDPVLASMHHDTEALDQDNQMLRAQCDDIRSELDGFRSGLHDSLADVAALLETLSGIEDRHQKAAASSPRRLRYGRNPSAVPMAIENGPAPAAAAASADRSPAVHISRRGSVTINT
eukprot:INCI6152.10.p1 GENE.INCI6152.10~~INCI6152.10.p1  ORF type:complete len:445 (+),score=97.59 INCI6152.10:173-1507(+)